MIDDKPQNINTRMGKSYGVTLIK